jgi:hypothetical protein
MESPTHQSSKSALFKVYLRLRPPPPSPPLFQLSTATQTQTQQPERFLSVEPPTTEENVGGSGSLNPTHITLNPPNDNHRRRAVEKFAFTRVFEEDEGQREVFGGVEVEELVCGVLGGGRGGDGRDGLLATLGVTGSGKVSLSSCTYICKNAHDGARRVDEDSCWSNHMLTPCKQTHTILGSRSQRGLTQLSLDVLFRSIAHQILDPATNTSLHATVAASDPSEAQVMSAQMFIDSMFADPTIMGSRANSRAPTPMLVSQEFLFYLSGRGEEGGVVYPSLARMSALVKRESECQGQERGSDRGEVKNQVPGAYPESNRSSMTPAPTVSPKKYFLRSTGSVNVKNSIPSYMSSTFSNVRKYVSKSPHAKQDSEIQGEYHIPPTPRRNLLTRPSALPLSPDISNIIVDSDPHAEYSVLISMYEVYNDRIFDLLTPALPNKGTKDFRRRPLLFKFTEQSPDRKVVAGLRKIICSNLKEALMVLEAGLHERRVAGTGSNSVSSRSHGFFCVEVKKRRRGGRGLWGGSALTIVDLAGSERARDAKTQGATLQEAGKINESLMYLGQCLQMQSDAGNSTKVSYTQSSPSLLSSTMLLYVTRHNANIKQPHLVPYRQCKLTELLFSNSFPSSHTTQSSVPTTTHRAPQRAVMIVTADPHGDFNATSQILRYSALAREITVPRIPSVTSTILAASTSNNYFGPRLGSGRYSPTETERETMEIAALEIARMSEEIDGLRAELIRESERREELEAKLESANEREIEIEADVREQCYTEMEERFRVEMESWKARWMMEREEVEDHVDRKLEILGRLNGNVVDDEDKENSFAGQGFSREEELDVENERLRREVEMLRREMQNRSPTKSQRMPLRESRLGGSGSGSLEREMGKLSIGGDVGEQRSPAKKAVRKLGGRRWVEGEEGF